MEALRRHAGAGEPLESCALLFGSVLDGKVTVNDVYETGNAACTPTSFAIPDGELIRAYAEAERRGVQIVGVFHSHPSSEAVPSRADEEFMRINPVVWVIYSGTDERFRAYVLDSKVREIPIEIDSV